MLKEALIFVGKSFIKSIWGLIKSPWKIILTIKHYTEKWKTWDLTQKSQSLIIIVIVCLSLFISGTWLLEGISLKYRKDFRDLNKNFYSSNLPDVREGRIQNEQLNKDIDGKNKNTQFIMPDGSTVTLPWGISNGNLHWILNKNPSPIDMSQIIFMLAILSAAVAGLNGGITSFKNLQLPKGMGEKIPDDQLNRMWLMLSMWGLLFLTIVTVKKIFTDTDIYTNVTLPLPLETVSVALGLMLLSIAFGIGFAEITNDSDKKVSFTQIEEEIKQLKEKVEAPKAEEKKVEESKPEEKA